MYVYVCKEGSGEGGRKSGSKEGKTSVPAAKRQSLDMLFCSQYFRDNQQIAWHLLRETLKKWKKSINSSHLAMSGIQVRVMRNAFTGKMTGYCMWCLIFNINNVSVTYSKFQFSSMAKPKQNETISDTVLFVFHYSIIPEQE